MRYIPTSQAMQYTGYDPEEEARKRGFGTPPAPSPQTPAIWAPRMPPTPIGTPLPTMGPADNFGGQQQGNGTRPATATPAATSTPTPLPMDSQSPAQSALMGQEPNTKSNSLGSMIKGGFGDFASGLKDDAGGAMKGISALAGA